MKQPKNSLQLLKPTRNTRKIANNLLIAVTSGKLNLQRKQYLICYVAKVEAAMSGHSMADVMPFYGRFNIPFEFSALLQPKENTFYT